MKMYNYQAIYRMKQYFRLAKILGIVVLLFLWVYSCSGQIGYIQCGQLPSRCLVINNLTYEEVVKQVDGVWKDSICLFEEDFAGEYSFTCYIDPPGSFPEYIMYFEPGQYEEGIEGYSLIGHEVIHLLQYLCDFYNIDFITEYESTAYLFEHLMNETFKVINDEKD